VETTGQTTAGLGAVVSPMRRLVRLTALLLAGIAGVIIGLAILSALAHPAGAATPPVSSVTPGTPPVALVPTIPALPTSPAAVTPVATPEATPVVTPVSGYVGPLAAPDSLPTAAVRAAAPAAAASIASLASPAITAIGNLDAQVSSLLPTVRGDVLFLADGVVLMHLPAASPGAGIPTATTGVGTIRGSDDSLLAHDQGRAAGLATGAPSSEPAPAPLSPAPTLPYPSPRSPLTAGDSTVASITAQGNSPFGSLPPSSRLLPVLALGAVLLARSKTPRLLLDARCSPPG